MKTKSEQMIQSMSTPARALYRPSDEKMLSYGLTRHHEPGLFVEGQASYVDYPSLFERTLCVGIDAHGLLTARYYCNPLNERDFGSLLFSAYFFSEEDFDYNLLTTLKRVHAK
jgi:hypothetical protein